MDEATKAFLEEINGLRGAAEEAAALVGDEGSLENWRVDFLGRRSPVSQLAKRLSEFPPDARPSLGRAVNELKAALDDLHARLKARVNTDAGAAPAWDYTLPATPVAFGRLHPVTSVGSEIISFFSSLGFGVAYGPEIEDDYHNFGALNFPDDHPSRDLHDTLYITRDLLLRTHTSPVQVRVMAATSPPLRIIAPGRCFRQDAVDASHFPVFTQVEGLLVDEGVSLGDLKGTLASFCRFIFGPETKMRFRPHFFPFTEPSAEVDIACAVCRGTGCATCGGKGWLEIAGAGMVHPHVFRNVGYDAEKWTGFAFGMGVERIAMLKYGVNDIRLFYENDLRFLRQF